MMIKVNNWTLMILVNLIILTSACDVSNVEETDTSESETATGLEAESEIQAEAGVEVGVGTDPETETKTYAGIESEAAIETETSDSWGAICAENEDCIEPTDFCVKQSGMTEGYCTYACTNNSHCTELGSPTLGPVIL